jgi:hypothetical protein
MEKPAKDPFATMPKGTFDMDDFKRFYSNNDEDKSIPYFWDKFDKENYSIWRCDYKYCDELTMVFMSCNLIGGEEWEAAVEVSVARGFIFNPKIPIWVNFGRSCKGLVFLWPFSPIYGQLEYFIAV